MGDIDDLSKDLSSRAKLDAFLVELLEQDGCKPNVVYVYENELKGLGAKDGDRIMTVVGAVTLSLTGNKDAVNASSDG